MAAELQLATPTTALDGEVLDPAALLLRAAEVAARQRSPETRRTYAGVYGSFAAFLGPSATAANVTPETVRAYRDALERAGRAPTTVAKHLSALRGLAEALGADAAVRTVRSARVGRGEPRALTHDEWTRLLRMPDRRTRQGKRDLALLHLLGSAGLRRAEATAVLVADVDERRRASEAAFTSGVTSFLHSGWETRHAPLGYRDAFFYAVTFTNATGSFRPHVGGIPQPRRAAPHSAAAGSGASPVVRTRDLPLRVTIQILAVCARASTSA